MSIYDNTSELENILAAVNALPNAGGSTPTPEAVEQATPSITVSASGLITAKATQAAGYVAGGTKSATKQLTTKGATTITPGTAVKTAVAAGTYVTGDIKVAAVQSGGSGTVETCSLTFDMSKTSENSIYVYYATVENGAVTLGGKRIETTTSITVVKNTPLFLQYDVYDEYSNLAPTANANMEIMFDIFWGFTITGDATITADTY